MCKLWPKLWNKPVFHRWKMLMLVLRHKKAIRLLFLLVLAMPVPNLQKLAGKLMPAMPPTMRIMHLLLVLPYLQQGVLLPGFRLCGTLWGWFPDQGRGM